MTDPTLSQAASASAPQGLLRRALGAIFSPRATYAEVAARPRAIGAVAAVLVILGTATGTLLSTDVGKSAYIDQAATAAESFGVQMTDQVLSRIETQARYAAYVTVGAQVVLLPLAGVILAAVAVGVFQGLLDAKGSFRQAFAIVCHSYFLLALQALFVTPINYQRESLSSATSLAIFLPMLDDASLLGRFLGSVDLFRIWWLVSLSIGFGVLYKKKTGPIAGSLLGIYVLIVLVIAAIRTVLSGA